MPGNKRKAGSNVLMISAGLLVLLFAALPTATVLAVGMVPTVVALIVDVTPGRYLARCVAGLNVAGTLPFIHRLWDGGHTMNQAFAILGDVYAWLVIYSASAIGWLLFLGLPSAVAIFRQLNAKRRIYHLRQEQKELVEEWGEGILPPGESRKGAPPAEASAPTAKRDGKEEADEAATAPELARRATAAGRP